jgi:hypothetical protein
VSPHLRDALCAPILKPPGRGGKRGELGMKWLWVIVLLLPRVALAGLPPEIESRLVAAHNGPRAELGEAPLHWSPRLADDAERWARHLAEIGRMEHWGARGERPNGEGENLWMGTRGRFTVEQMVGAWANEKLQLRHLRRWEDDFHAVGHYTQMVWRGTTSVGCAIARNQQFEFLVCRYAPQGNIMGQNPY